MSSLITGSLHLKEKKKEKEKMLNLTYHPELQVLGIDQKPLYPKGHTVTTGSSPLSTKASE